LIDGEALRIPETSLLSEGASIFFLTSNFNISIQSSTAVFFKFQPHIHEKWKRENRKHGSKEKRWFEEKGWGQEKVARFPTKQTRGDASPP
jgi:hypothetical protein